MNKYDNKISIFNKNDIFFRQSRFKKSYEIIIDVIFEELNEKYGKDCDKILEYKGHLINLMIIIIIQIGIAFFKKCSSSIVLFPI